MSRRRDDEDAVIDFTPETGFTIEKLAPQIVQMMREMDMDAHINLPGGITIEVERDCTVEEITAGYKEYIKKHVSGRSASNKNEKEPV